MKISMIARRTLTQISNICSSNRFLWLTIGFFVIESAWVATSFRFPMLFDEQYHLKAIEYFAHHLSPLAIHQAPQYDMYGNMAFSNASLYHYLMSFPYRLIVHFTTNFQVLITALRMINILLAAAGLWIYAKLLHEIGVRRVFINLSIFFYSIIPIVIFVSATISYDNLLLPLTAYFFLIGSRIIQAKKKPDSYAYIKFLLVGMLACLVKFSFLPIFAFGVGYIVVFSYRKYGKSLFWELVHNFKISSHSRYALATLAILVSLLFTARFVYPTIVYRTPMPDCSRVMTYSRCLKGGVYYGKEQAIKTKSTRVGIPIESFAQYWAASMASQLDISAANTGTKISFGRVLPILSSFMTISIFVGITALLYMWRSLRKTESWNFLMILVIGFLGFLFLFNATAYYSANSDLNTQTRYALSLYPLCMAMAFTAINQLMGRSSTIKLALLVLILFLCTQGAGDIKHIVTSSSDWYWSQNGFVDHINSNIRSLIGPFVKG